jgi:hypothetical protein
MTQPQPLDLLCPRCGAPREAEQEFCLECGLRLPPTSGKLARARRTWVKRLGWYPGDWIWTTLLALVVAIAGAVVAIVATRDARSTNGGTIAQSLPTLSVTVPAPTPTRTVDTTTLPDAPEPTATSSKPPQPKPPANGHTPWPAGRTGWTVVLESVPATQAGRKTSQARATRAAGDGLPDVGVLVSARYSTLHPGYYVIFSGIYDTRSQAESTLRAATSAGFSAAYVRQIAQ